MKQQRISSLIVAVVVRCLYAAGAVSGSAGELTRQVAATPVAQLLMSLVKADEPIPSGESCAASGAAPLPILLGDRSGHFLHPDWPQIRCRVEPADVSYALAQLTWRTVSRTRIARLPS